MNGIQKMVAAAVGMVITLAAPWAAMNMGIDITGMGETLTQIVLGVLTVAGVYQVTNK